MPTQFLTRGRYGSTDDEEENERDISPNTVWASEFGRGEEHTYSFKSGIDHRKARQILSYLSTNDVQSLDETIFSKEEFYETIAIAIASDSINFPPKE